MRYERKCGDDDDVEEMLDERINRNVGISSCGSEMFTQHRREIDGKKR